MARHMLMAGDLPTPGPWLVRGEACDVSSSEDRMLGIEPATDELAGGWPYLIRQDRPLAVGDCPLHIATGIQRLADGRLIAAAPALAEALLALMLSPGLLVDNLDPTTRRALATGWAVLTKAAPHFVTAGVG